MTATTDRFVKNNTPAWRDTSAGEFRGFDKFVWSEKKQTIIGYNELEFFPLWADLHAVWRHPHWSGALKFGCGRDTMAYTIQQVTGRRYDKPQVRWALWIGEALEWCIHNRTKGGYNAFLLRPIRYESEVPGCL